MQVEVAEEALTLNIMGETKTSPCLKYEEEWMKLCRVDLEMTGFREQIIDGALRASRFRSVIWRLLLGALTPGFSVLWHEEVATSRRHYQQLKAALQVTPSPGSEPDADNPLSQHEHSSWHQYFCDKELRSLIQQDVIRTFPGIDFFRSEQVQEAMINILFCYARENPTMCYRQGMHEVLAPVIFVFHSDHQALLHTQEQVNLRHDIIEVMNPDYLEDDSYTLFRRIMNAIEGSYLITNVAPTSTGYFPCHSNAAMNSNENQVISQLKWIKERILAPSDPELHDHLEKLDIPLPLFGIRWLRLLFGREFPLQDLLVLWDAIFAENKSFDLVNHIVVAMLSAIRTTLLNSDYTNCLTTLMRYPAGSDVSCIIEYALHLKNPNVYKMPPKMIIPKPKSKPPSKKIMNGTVQSKDAKPVRTKVNGVRPVQDFEETQTIIDGHPLNDPELLLKELRHCRNIMSLVSLKLLQYHKTLEKAVDPSDSPTCQALTGIYELSSLLNGNLRNPVVVDKAYEVRPKELNDLTPPPRPLPRLPSIDLTVFHETSTPYNETEEEERNRMWLSLKNS